MINAPDEISSSDGGKLVHLLVRLSKLVAWAVAVYLVQVIAHLILFAFFNQYTDQCSQYYESPNNVGGWSIAIVAVLLPTIIGWTLRKHLTIVWITLGMIVQSFLFVDAILGLGPC